MILNELKAPIQIINMPELGINAKLLSKQLRATYRDDYQWDDYHYRQSKINYIVKSINTQSLGKITHDIWDSYYRGSITDDTLLTHIEKSLSSTLACNIKKIKPSRKRLISAYELTYKELEWHIKRTPAGKFKQPCGALKNSTKITSYKTVERTFKELPTHLEDDSLHKILTFIAQNLQQNLQIPPQHIHITVHHTLVFCYPDAPGSNAPEGIHQDGIDFIISALVIERHNIEGGTSIIFGCNGETELMKVTLREGQGILQPDKNSELWHSVTPIACIDKTQEGYRSTLGFDISILA